MRRFTKKQVPILFIVFTITLLSPFGWGNDSELKPSKIKDVKIIEGFANSAGELATTPEVKAILQEHFSRTGNRAIPHEYTQPLGYDNVEMNFQLPEELGIDFRVESTPGYVPIRPIDAVLAARDEGIVGAENLIPAIWQRLKLSLGHTLIYEIQEARNDVPSSESHPMKQVQDPSVQQLEPPKPNSESKASGSDFNSERGLPVAQSEGQNQNKLPSIYEERENRQVVRVQFRPETKANAIITHVHGVEDLIRDGIADWSIHQGRLDMIEAMYVTGQLYLSLLNEVPGVGSEVTGTAGDLYHSLNHLKTQIETKYGAESAAPVLAMLERVSQLVMPTLRSQSDNRAGLLQKLTRLYPNTLASPKSDCRAVLEGEVQ